MSDNDTENKKILPTESSNINISELDDETNKKLKGDVIGDTLYSQSFVLKTLLKFSNFEWNEQFEEDLCFLWDMTVEKDVCSYLFSVSYPSLACAALEKSDEPRFVEIVIGILGNILCIDCENRQISNEELNIVLRELNSDDPLILIQVMRVISAVAHAFPNVSCIDEEKITKIKFIMNNSVNNELLEKTLEAVTKLTQEFKLNKIFVNLELYEVTLTAYHTIFNNIGEFSLDCKDKVAACRYMLEIICNICSYINQYDSPELLLEIQRHSDKYVNEILKILRYLSVEENLMPITDEMIFFTSVFRFTLTTLNINYDSDLFKLLCKMFLMIIDIKDEVTDMFDDIVEMLCFLISKDSKKKCNNVFKTLSKNKVGIILRSLKDNQHKFVDKFDVQDLLVEYSNKYK